MSSKQYILEEIRRTATENGGKPLGAARFEQETGINTYGWGKHWARFGDALKDAGFAPNRFDTDGYDGDFLIRKLIDITRKLSKFPTFRDIEVEKSNDSELPNKKVFSRLGTKQQLATKVLEYCNDRADCEDVAKLCRSIAESAPSQRDSLETTTSNQLGEVYLFKSGRYYKIGRTSDSVRRGHEIRILLPEKMELIHSIKTDDPSGIESYWHRRFEAKRLQGEWFDLKSLDIKAFKRWKRIH